MFILNEEYSFSLNALWKFDIQSCRFPTKVPLHLRVYGNYSPRPETGIYFTSHQTR